MDDRKWVAVCSIVMMQLVSISFFILYEMTLPLPLASLNPWAAISRLLCFLFFLLILLFPLTLLNYEPLYLLKCISIVYKRRSYTRTKLWLMFYFSYLENLAYPLSVLCCSSAVGQLAGILAVLTFKLLLLRKVIKRIEVLRILALLGFFASLLVGCYTEKVKTELMSAMLLLVLFIELLKIGRGLLLLILGFFKDKQEQPRMSTEEEKPRMTTKEEKARMTAEQRLTASEHKLMGPEFRPIEADNPILMHLGRRYEEQGKVGKGEDVNGHPLVSPDRSKPSQSRAVRRRALKKGMERE